MMRIAEVGSSVLRRAESSARLRAQHGMRRMVLVMAAGVLVLGAMVFASVGLMLLLSRDMGLDTAALLVAALWVVLAVAALVWAVTEQQRREPPVIPAEAGDEMLAAFRKDLGDNAPIITLAALAVGLLTALRR
jgi:hypothetical protein